MRSVMVVGMILIVSGTIAQNATDWVSPLPKKIAFGETAIVPVAELGVTLGDGAGDVVATAREQIVTMLEEKTGVRPEGSGFEILLGVCDERGTIGDLSVPGASELARLKNSDQAYVIRPMGNDRLVVAGLTEQAVFHGAITVKWLLAAGIEGDTVTIPLARVTDWPDISERGEWGGSANGDIQRFADEKMNLIESHCRLSMADDGRGEGSIGEDFVEEARLHAIKVVPILTHLDQLKGTGIYDTYPELKGIGGTSTALGGRVMAPCASKPKFTEILGDWLASLATMKGVDTVCCWLSEHHVQCGCDDCQQVGQYVLEAQSLVKGWENARKQHPDLKLRILLTQGSYTSNAQVIAATPPEVQITYYDGGRTYDSSRDEMIYPLLEEYTASGRWLGCYPQLTASWRIVCPWSGPQFIRYRMQEFVEDGLECLCGYATPHNDLYDFNVAAASEWSWNSTGRDEVEFGTAWATRRGLPEPGAVAAWAEMLGPVGWDVYGSRVPYSAFFGGAGRMIADRQQPKLGEGMFRCFPTQARFNIDLATCDAALGLARDAVGEPMLIAETEALRGYVTMLKELYTIASMYASSHLPDDAARQALQDAVTRLAQASMDTTDALREWEVAASGGNHYGGSRFGDTVDVNAKTVSEVAAALAPLGITDPSAASRERVAGTWVSDDFEEGERVTKRFDVTELLDGAGTYQIHFKYTSGWWGTNIHRAALAVDETEVAADEHVGMAAYASAANVYTLVVEEHDEGATYTLVIDIKGVASRGRPADRQGCNGEVSVRKVRVDDEPLKSPEVGPVAESLQSIYGPPQFNSDGLAVGVVTGGYGSGSVLRALEQQRGLNAQPVGLLEPDWIKDCDVIVLPQPHDVASLTVEQVELLEAFARGGGGVVATHSAVGYRGFPPLLTSICASGLGHVRDTGWRVALAHPITDGIDMDRVHEHSYYDHIELEAGPQGTVVASAGASGKPVVICGDVGEGRYVACGLLPGIGRGSDNEVEVEGEELKLIVNAVRWSAG